MFDTFAFFGNVQHWKETIDKYMSNNSPGASSSGDIFDDSYEDEDAETKQDFDDFKTWLESRGDPPKSQSPRADKKEVVVKDVIQWRCNLCKKLRPDECNLPRINLDFCLSSGKLKYLWVWVVENVTQQHTKYFQIQLMLSSSQP